MYIMIFILSLDPFKYATIGEYPDYKTCAEERTYQSEESDWMDRWACVKKEISND